MSSTPVQCVRTAVLHTLSLAVVGPVVVAAGGQSVWVDEARLGPTTPWPNQHFGTSAAIQGDRLAMGSTRDPEAGNRGSVSISRRDSGWTFEARLVSGDGQVGDAFAQAVALDDDTCLVGCPGDDRDDPNLGAAYVFRRTGTIWVEEQKLVASDGEESDFFGKAVALEGDLAVVSSDGADVSASNDGALYVFERTGTTWAETAKLVSPAGINGDRFGIGLDLDGDTIVAGAQGSDDVASDAGAVHVFVRTGTTWAFDQTILAPDGEAGDHFGIELDLDGDTLATYASRVYDEALQTVGRVYVHTRSGTTWSHVHTVAPEPGERLRGPVLEGDLLALADDVGDGFAPATGIGFVHRRDGGSWNRIAQLQAVGAETNDFLGSSLALSDGRVVIGAVLVDEGGWPSSGAAWVFDVEPDAPGAPSCFGDGTGVACPCGNSGGPGEGCAHSGGFGIVISGGGQTSVLADNLTLFADQCPPGNTGLFYAGKTLLSPAQPLVDGVQCVGGEVRRFRGVFQATGSVADSELVAQDPSGIYFEAGATVHFQYWTRDVAAGPSPCGSQSTLSPAYGVTMSL